MGNRMLAQLTINEREHIFQVTDQLTTFLHQYFLAYPEFNHIRFPAIALATAVENPTLPINILENIVKVTAWIFAIDDVIDGKRLSESVLRQHLSYYEKIVHGEILVVAEHEQYAVVLLDLTNTIRKSPLYPDLKQLWEKAYTNMIRGMLFEVSEPLSDVSMDKYLEHGLYSVGVPNP
jgi:hypothetical protein